MGFDNVIKQFQTPETLTIKMIYDTKCCTATSGGRFFQGISAVLTPTPPHRKPKKMVCAFTVFSVPLQEGTLFPSMPESGNGADPGGGVGGGGYSD